MITIRNALSPFIYSEIKHMFMRPDFSWKWCERTAFTSGSFADSESDKILREKYADRSSFGNNIFWSDFPENTKGQHKLFASIQLPILDTLQRYKFFVKDLLRIRIGLIPGSIDSNKVMAHMPHIDYTFPHQTALIYFTTCNAPTIIYNEKFDHEKFGEDPSLIDLTKMSFTEKRRVECVENTMFVFDGLHYHSSTIPFDVDRRVVMNINFIKK